MREVRRPYWRVAALCAGASIGASLSAAPAVLPTPEGILGRKVGEDHFLAPYHKVIEYFRALDAASDRVSLEMAGKSTLGNDMLLVILTSAANQRNLERYRGIAKRLAHPEDVSEPEARGLIDSGKSIVLVTCTIHSTEVGSTQMAMELAHDLAAADDPETTAWLEDVILLLMPSINPDGQVMVIDWYNKYLGTPFEGGAMPWLYHHYVGHDNNRDFYMLTQKETQVVNDVLYHRWFPQVFLDEHQMGSVGPRMFVPPQTDPVAPEIDSMILREADLLGTAMGLRLEQAGKTGVGHDMIFDSYWPGGTRNTAWWKNVVGLLTEVASARIATPVYVEPGELRGGKGLPEHVRQSNYLSPWAGGWWRLRDIIDYELIATRGLLETCSRYRRDILATFHSVSRKAIERGRREPPYAFVVPPGQHDPVAAAKLIDLMLRHGVRVERAEAALRVPRPPALGGAAGPSDPNATAADATTVSYPPGAYVLRASQPYRAFLLTMLQPQRYPEVAAYAKGPIIEPYDVTSWSLPISMGVDVARIDEPVDWPAARLRQIDAPSWPGGPVENGPGGYLIPHSADSAFVALNRLLKRRSEVYWLRQEPSGGSRGDLYVPPAQATAQAMSNLSRDARVPVRPLAARPAGPAYLVASAPRVGLYKPWVASMDEGWTRWLLERYEFPLISLSNEQIQKGAFTKMVDVLLLPAVEAAILKEGKPAAEEQRSFAPLPPPYAGGLEKAGGEQIRRWVAEEGGHLVALDSAADYVIELLDLPVTNVLAKVRAEEFSCPGSMLRLMVDTASPIAYGMRPVEAGYFSDSPAFQTRLPDGRFDRRVIATYPEHADQVLVSGYLKGAARLERKAAVVDLTVGKGRVVLIGMRAQHRAQPHRTFKLLFNSLYLGRLREVSLP